MEQTWEYYLNGFPHRTSARNGRHIGTNYDNRSRKTDTIWLPRPLLTSVTSIKYTESGDSTDYSNTFAATNYSVITKRKPGCIVLKDASVWPSTALESNDPIQIIYVAGYGDERSDVPDALKHAIKLVLAEIYENRQDTVFSMRIETIGWLQRLLAPYKNWWPM